MEHHSIENLDEDGYTQLDFSSCNIIRKPVVSEKGFCAASPRWRPIAVTLGILCLVMLVITVVLCTMGVLSSSCPPNWITHQNSCYLFSTSLDSWDTSKRRCLQLGSNLLKIDSLNELEFISRQVSSQLDHSFWIGLSRRQTEEPWLWDDGSMLLSNLFQIRRTVTKQDSSHSCVWIHVSVIYDQLCSVPSYSICEKKLST
ncbi:C-type lectin domain family 7 member A isoform X2 [Lagenorhynchus albirostris]|uniref:C-type lectin domain family 7 member A isoform X2 n=1 Tax=Tursiops truncatus TaxID=9739 RepID=A0A2U3VA12_TURTR|nr:C-type lectin domain family 7 member A isoform X2 [Tursiops truncatus]XP_060021459.1 C-type lectin domain family 7 member A isoform X2 [Lagenorhynchus albirostris]